MAHRVNVNGSVVRIAQIALRRQYEWITIDRYDAAIEQDFLGYIFQFVLDFKFCVSLSKID